MTYHLEVVRDLVQNFGRADAEAEVLAHLIAGRTHTEVSYEDQLCYTNTRTKAVRVRQSRVRVGTAVEEVAS